MTAGDLYHEGKLGEALALATQEVRQHPADTARRWLLAELLCVSGEWDRADKQLDALNPPDPPTSLAVAAFRQLIRAEIARHQVFHEGRLPEFIEPPSAAVQLHLRALVALREQKPGEARQLVTEAIAARPALCGRCDGAAFAAFGDTDECTASFLEVHSPRGKYYWVPFELIERIELHAPQRPRDLLWRPVHMVVRGTTGSELFLPAVYITTYTQGDDLARLARGTSWLGGDDGPVVGVGQRVFEADGRELPLLELKRLEIEAGPAPAAPTSA
ncbi:MAG: tetratricopeptide repeat protein [Pirellulaceae bacterium]|nr:tetratricopeptide repeat protein [Pirellulaceae bacterium]